MSQPKTGSPAPTQQAPTGSTMTPERRAQIDAMLAGSKQSAAPQQPSPDGFKKFANTISAPFRAVSDAVFKPVVETMAKPFGEFAAGISGLQGKQAPAWTNDNRLTGPTQLAVGKHGISQEAAKEAEMLKAQGYKGAGFTDVLNVASIAPSGAFVKGAGTLARATETSAKTIGLAPKFVQFGKTVSDVAPAAVGWGGAYGAAQNLDSGKQGQGILGDTLKGAGVGLATGVGLAGAGSLIGSGLQKGSQVLNKDLRTQAIANKNYNALSELENSNAVLRKLVEGYNKKGIDVKRKLADTDFLVGSVDESGTIRTLGDDGALSKLEDFIRPQEDVISNNLKREGKTTSLQQLQREMLANIKNSDIRGADEVAAIRKVSAEIEGLKLRADAEGNIPLWVVHDAKRYKYKNLDYSNPASKNTDKAIARTLKEAVENNTDSIDVKRTNDELAEYYAMLSFLEKLDGKKVKGGRLGKYFAQIIGGAAGTHIGGPVGTLVGAEIGGRLQGKMMRRTFNKASGKEMKVSDAMTRAVNLGKSPKTPPGIIPENRRIGYSIKPPQPDATRILSQEEARAQLKERGWQNVGQSSESLLSTPGKQKTTQSAAKMEAKRPISEILSQLSTKSELDAEIANRIENFRQEAGLLADREGAGVNHRNVEDAAGNFQFQAKDFSLNKAKGSMKRQANSAKLEAGRLLYENDPDFRAIVDKKDELFAHRVEMAKDDAEFLSLINEVNDEIKAVKYVVAYEQPKSQPKASPALVKAPERAIDEAPKVEGSKVIEGLKYKSAEEAANSTIPNSSTVVENLRGKGGQVYRELLNKAKQYDTAEKFIEAVKDKDFIASGQEGQNRGVLRTVTVSARDALMPKTNPKESLLKSEAYALNDRMSLLKNVLILEPKNKSLKSELQKVTEEWKKKSSEYWKLNKKNKHIKDTGEETLKTELRNIWMKANNIDPMIDIPF